jgi:hypothetical protein
MKKLIILWLSAVGILSLGQYAYADIGNCQDRNTSVVVWRYDTYQNMYPAWLIAIAQKNLKRYCCKYEFLDSPSTKEACERDDTNTYIESPRLYDHLVDVGMRYIDGEEVLQYPWWAVDTKWKEWRKLVTEFWSNQNGGIPLDLRAKYAKAWGSATQHLYTDYRKTSCQDSKTRFVEYDSGRNDALTLTQKYFILCEVSSCIVDETKNRYIWVCKQMVEQKIKAENSYVQLLLIHQWAMALQNNFDAYAIWYVTHEKFWRLLEKIVMMSKWLWFINDKVSEMTKTCSS